MKLFVIHHGLIHGGGHNYSCALGFQAECTRRGIGHHAYVHRDCHPEIVAKLGASAVFPYTPVTMLSKDPLCGELQNFMGRATAFARAISSIPRFGRDRTSRSTRASRRTSAPPPRIGSRSR